MPAFDKAWYVLGGIAAKRLDYYMAVFTSSFSVSVHVLTLGAVVGRLGVELRPVFGMVLRLGTVWRLEMVFEVVLTVGAVLRVGVVLSGVCCRGMITGRVEDNCVKKMEERREVCISNHVHTCTHTHTHTH